MKNVKKMIGRLLRDESGTETLEWGLICGLVIVGAIAAMTFIGPKITKVWNDTNSAVSAIP
ncbi:MAG TPA: Flp family type IVb pilin [Tepidisphaeraceae bacterium]